MGHDLLVDAHVHFHPCFDRERFLTAASDNFAAGAEELGIDGRPLGCLLFTESSTDHYFAQLRQFGEEPTDESGGWSLELTEENCSLLAKRGEDTEMFLIAGRQIVTCEGLEVLALLCFAEFPDGLPLREALTAVVAAGGVPVLPWGFGKWLFGRGALVSRTLESLPVDPLFLGDNGGRLRWGPTPRHLREGMSLGVRVLPGSDPLPFSAQMTRPGSYGFHLHGEIDPSTPARSVDELLATLEGQPPVYGQRAEFLSFSFYQCAMQWKKRLEKRVNSGAGYPVENESKNRVR